MPSPDPVTEREAPQIESAKDTLRAAVRRLRASRSDSDRRAGDQERTRLTLGALGDWRPARVAAYAHRDGEPATDALLDALAGWATVLLPVLSPSEEGPRREPQWARYEGRTRLRAGLWGIPEPTSDPLGQDALHDVELVILPGIAGSPAGDRLGTGGGWYDRALAGTSAPRWLLLNDDEVVDEVPVDPWDLPVSTIITNRRVLRCW